MGVLHPTRRSKNVKRILVVDDEGSTIFGLRAIMSSKDVTVLTALDAVSAKAIMEDCSIDLLLSDIRLSTGNRTEGIDLLEYIKVKCPNTRVVLMTGYGSAEVQRRAVAAGADFYFEKPMDLDQLGNIIGRLLFDSDVAL